MSFPEIFLMTVVMLGTAAVPAGAIMAGVTYLTRVTGNGVILVAAITGWVVTVLSCFLWLLQAAGVLS